MNEDRAKAAVEARAELAQALADCANALAAAAQVLIASSVAVTEAAEKEQAASQLYISELEARLSQQREAS